MKTKTIYKSAILTAAVALLAGCVKDDLYDTPHPDAGKIRITADWSARGEGLAIPAAWQVRIGDYAGVETDATHSPDYLFAPGDYLIAAWNPADDITVSGTEASVAADADHAGCIAGCPGWLFTSVQEVLIEQDCDYEFTAAMRQQVRQLTLVIEPAGDSAERIEGIEARLSGAAGSMDFASDTYGSESGVALDFTQAAEGAGKWTATVRLLGIAGAQPRLTGTISFAGGNPLPLTLESDLTEALADFNGAKNTPLTLGGTVVETPAGAGFSATIDGWQTVMGEPVEAM